MILAHIIVKEKKYAKKIAKLLMQHRLIFSASISTKKVFEMNQNTGRVEQIKQTTVTGKTKALLFTRINAILREKYPLNMPMIFALPIIYMDEQQTDLLRTQTAKV